MRGGFRVALYDYGNAAQDDVRSIARYLGAHGATSIALVGASEGAKASILAAPGLRPQPDALVSLSAESTLLGTPVMPYAKRLRCPTLFVTAAHDAYGSDDATRSFYRAAPARAKKLVVVPGSAHGTATLSDGSVARAVLAFLQARAG